MQTSEILAAIDDEISHLQQARALLAAGGGLEQTGKQRGRPKGSVNRGTVPAVKTARSRMSPEGKARIAAAQKARWAAQRKSGAPAKGVAKKTIAAPGKKAATAKKAASAEGKPAAKRGRPRKETVPAKAVKTASPLPPGAEPAADA